MLTKNQKKCLERARRYSRKNYRSINFGKLYLEFCNDNPTSYRHFLYLVQGYEGIEAMPTKVEPVIPFADFIAKYESLFLGERLKASA